MLKAMENTPFISYFHLIHSQTNLIQGYFMKLHNMFCTFKNMQTNTKKSYSNMYFASVQPGSQSQ